MVNYIFAVMTVRPRGLQAAAQYSSMQLSVHSGHVYDDSSFMKKILSCMINVDHSLYHGPYTVHK